MTAGQVGVVHVHSDYSHDGLDTLERLRDASQARGIAFVGLTDHAEDFDPGVFAEYVEHCASLSDGPVSLIPGLEYRFAGYPGLHLLALGLRHWISPDSPEAFAREAPSAAAFTIVAHPVLPRYRVPDTVLETVDAIEVWNAAYNTRYLPDTRAVRLYHALHRRRPEVVATAGLDQHDSRNDRETRVILQQPSADPLAELKAGRFINRGRTLSFDARVSWNGLQLAGYSVARWSLDRVNGLHESLMHRLRRRRRGRR